VIDIYSIFNLDKDYANPIEPSVYGGDKITNNILKIMKEYNWKKEGYTVFANTDYHEEEYKDIEVEITKEEKERMRNGWGPFLSKMRLETKSSDEDEEEEKKEEKKSDEKESDTKDNESYRSKTPSKK